MRNAELLLPDFGNKDVKRLLCLKDDRTLAKLEAHGLLESYKLGPNQQSPRRYTRASVLRLMRRSPEDLSP